MCTGQSALPHYCRPFKSISTSIRILPAAKAAAATFHSGTKPSASWKRLISRTPTRLGAEGPACRWISGDGHQSARHAGLLHALPRVLNIALVSHFDCGRRPTAPARPVGWATMWNVRRCWSRVRDWRFGRSDKLDEVLILMPPGKTRSSSRIWSIRSSSCPVSRTEVRERSWARPSHSVTSSAHCRLTGR